MKVLNTLAAYAKAVAGFVAPGIVILVGAMQDASPGGSTITAAEWGTAAAACVLTSVGVAFTPNIDRDGTHAEQSVQPRKIAPEDVLGEPEVKP